jgi:protoheme ferro-lyase
MGFRTLALEKQASEVWKVLGAVKTEFERYGEWVAKVREQVQKAADTLDKADTRSKQMRRALKVVEALPETEALVRDLRVTARALSAITEKIDQELAQAYLPSQIGIILMNHGCPHEAKGFTSGIDESQALYELVREKLIYKYPLISVGWLNHQTPLIKWTQPNADLAARNLIELGAKALIFMPIGFATENHETLLDVAHIMEHLAKKYPDVNYIQMPCVNDHPVFCQMVADWAHPQIEDLLAETALSINPNSAPHDHGHHHHHDHDHPHHHHHH